MVPPLEIRHPLRSQGTNFETNFFKFRWFLGPSDQNKRKKLWDDPLDYVLTLVSHQMLYETDI